jgi:Zn-dependent oligopeptidase
MVPCIDMANHGSGDGVKALYDADSERNAVLRTCRAMCQPRLSNHVHRIGTSRNRNLFSRLESLYDADSERNAVLQLRWVKALQPGEEVTIS